MHLRRANHKMIAAHPKTKVPPVECYVCGNTNIFTMGIVPAEYVDVLVILCATPCARLGKYADVTWNPNCLKSLVREKAISGALVKRLPLHLTNKESQPTAEEISQLEAYWEACADTDPFNFEAMTAALPEVNSKTTFETTKEYSVRFSRLLTLERDFAQTELERQATEDISLRWSVSRGNAAQAFIAVAELNARPNVGDELTVCHPDAEWSSTGRVASTNSFGREICVEFGADESVPFGCNAGFTVTPKWNATGFDRMLKALEAFASERPLLTNYLRRRLLGHHVDDICFPKEKPEQPPGLPHLNRSQTLGVQYALRRPLALVQGPPGTGKTLTAAAIVYNLALKHAEPILVCAPSNTAVDQLTERIATTGLTVVRLCARSKESISTTVTHLALHSLVKDYLVLNGIAVGSTDPKRLKILKANAEQQILKTADVITCTCTTAADARLKSLNIAACLIDECAQATEPECMIPITLGARHLILVGDHQQLGPVVACRAAARGGLSYSLFERLALGHIPPFLLETQYRMHPDLNWFPSSVFYDGKLSNGVKKSEREFEPRAWRYASTPTFFWTTNGVDERPFAQKTFSNRLEAANVKDLVNSLLEAGADPKTIGVITPYDGQRERITQALYTSKAFPRKIYDAVEVANVDAFQGREKEIIIISCVRANAKGSVGFLTDARRLNVALTRARRGLFIIGNHKTLGKNHPWDKLLQAYKDDGLIFTGLIASLHPLQF